MERTWSRWIHDWSHFWCETRTFQSAPLSSATPDVPQNKLASLNVELNDADAHNFISHLNFRAVTPLTVHMISLPLTSANGKPSGVFLRRKEWLILLSISALPQYSPFRHRNSRVRPWNCQSPAPRCLPSWPHLKLCSVPRPSCI